jgi:ATP-dependent protease HslVU (ClpYQ) ATPase subunit
MNFDLAFMKCRYESEIFTNDHFDARRSDYIPNDFGRLEIRRENRERTSQLFEEILEESV